MSHAILLVAVVSLVTIAVRALPFLVFGEGRKTPKVIAYLGEVLPYASMAMLVVYALKDVTFTSVSGWLPELIACVVVAGLHLWKRNTLLSIVGGTVCYMLLVQLVF